MMYFRILAVMAIGVSVVSLAMAQPDRKARIEAASGTEKIKLAIQFVEAQTKAADDDFRLEKDDEARKALADVSIYAKVAADTAAEQHRHEKDAEISLRKVAKHLLDVKNGAPYEDQPRVQQTIEAVQAARDEILDSMFRKKH